MTNDTQIGQTASRNSSNSFGKSRGAVVDRYRDERREEAPAQSAPMPDSGPPHCGVHRGDWATCGVCQSRRDWYITQHDEWSLGCETEPVITFPE